ncbi:unnamed protein product, partial [Medioppia subpectinata]
FDQKETSKKFLRNFLRQKFAGNARQQFIETIKKLSLVSSEDQKWIESNECHDNDDNLLNGHDVSVEVKALLRTELPVHYYDESVDVTYGLMVVRDNGLFDFIGTHFVESNDQNSTIEALNNRLEKDLGSDWSAIDWKCDAIPLSLDNDSSNVFCINLTADQFTQIEEHFTKSKSFGVKSYGLIRIPFLFRGSTQNCQLQCRDETGKEVDWYVVYKLPRITGAKPPLETGANYAYMTSESKSGWILSDRNITDEKSIFGQTLAPLYVKTIDPSISYLNYNDQPPNDTATHGAAHAKGVVAANGKQGFWLIHSVPHFAPIETDHQYVYPSTGTMYGQTALCISIDINQIDKVFTQLLYMQSYVYQMNITPELAKQSTKIDALKRKEWDSGKKSVVSITSSGGIAFTSFSKSPADLVDLYSGIVASELDINLYVETWRKGAGSPLPSECDLKDTVENVHEISLSFNNSKLTGVFDYLHDHSKWAISKTSTAPYVCFGDINRMKSQFKRGGATTCFKNPLVWKHMNEWVSKVDKCGKLWSLLTQHLNR